MKKAFYILIVFVISLMLFSCKSHEQETFEYLFNREYISYHIDITFDYGSSKKTEGYGSVLKTPNGFYFRDLYADYGLIYVMDRDLLLRSTPYNKYGNSVNASKVINFNINIEDYFVKKIYGPEVVYAHLDFYSYIKALNPNLLSPYLTEENGIIETKAIFENGRIIEYELDLTNIKSYFTDSTKVKRLTISLKSFSYNEERLPKYDLFYYDETNEEEFLNILKNSYNTENAIKLGRKFDFMLTKEYKLYMGEEFELEGYLYDKDNGQSVRLEHLNCDVIYTPEIDMTAVGTKKYKVTIITKDSYCKGYTFEKEITINITKTVQVDKEVLFDGSNIEKIFLVQDYLLVADENKLYKIDTSTNTIVDSVNILAKCSSVYYKDGFLYAAAYYPYESDYKEEDEYSGVITKINYDTFEIEQQVEVNCYPYTIIVDNRNQVIVSKGLSQHVNHSFVDMSTGALTTLTSGYEMDYLIYDSINDCIHIITQHHTGGNELLVYKDDNYVIDLDGSSIRAGYVLYSNNNGEVILSNYGNDVLFSYYNSNAKKYINKEIVLTSSNYDKKAIAYDEGIIYKLYLPNSSSISMIDFYNTETNEKGTLRINLEISDIKQAIVKNNYLYICYSDSDKLFIYDLNK